MKNNFLRIMSLAVFLIFLALYYSSNAGIIDYQARNRTALTEEQIKMFEDDVKNNVEIDIKKYLDDFITASKPIIDNQIYSLDITYDTYSYQNIVSYVFTIFINTGGAHPNTIIDTISYDKKENKVITISELVKDNPDLLSFLSNKSREELLKNKDLQNQSIKEMLLEGTTPTNDNFKNFAFAPNGFTVYFNRYQVAPYSYGSFYIIIPYSELNINRRS